MENISFELNEKETNLAYKFISKHKQCKCTDALCQKYEYRFYPGGLGSCIVIKCLICGEEANITDIDSW
jgi:hypothetical protein